VKYTFKTLPYEHQVKAIKKAMRQFRQGLGIGFLMEPRTGKTKATIDTLSILHLKYDVEKVLIIAPNRVLGTWVQEIHTHCPFNVQTIIWDVDGRKKVLPRDLGPYDMQMVIVNYEAFSTPGRKTASGRRSRASGRMKHRDILRKWLDDDPHAAAVVDEGHKIKNPSGKAANMIVSLRPMFRYRFLLTGTPITKAKRAHDAYMLWQWINPKRFGAWGYTAKAFKAHVGNWISSNGYPQWVGPNEDGMGDLQRGIHKDSIVVFRDDCFDLPPQDTQIIKVPLRESARHYDEMAEYMVTQLENGEIAEASIPLVVTLRLQQLTSGFVGIPKAGMTARGEEKYVTIPHRVGREKLRVLKELLEDRHVEDEEKVIIAARFKLDLDDIEKLCRSLKMPVYSIRGGMTRSASDDALKRFKRAPYAAMLIQPAAAALGIDLSTSRHMIWYSLTSSYVDFTQACDRIALSPRSTTITYLLGEGTVDELTYRDLLNDRDVSRHIMTKPRDILRRK
jgi:SNF2 family DNA or RNA helicase